LTICHHKCIIDLFEVDYIPEKQPIRISANDDKPEDSVSKAKPKKSTSKSNDASLTPAWKKVRDEWGVATENIETYKHVRKQNDYPNRPSLDAEIEKIDTLVEQDPYFKKIHLKDAAKKEILNEVVMKSLSPERALYHYACSDLNWVAQKIGLSEAFKSLLEDYIGSLSYEGRSQFGKSVLRHMPLINLLFSKDDYYHGEELEYKKLYVFNRVRQIDVTADEMFNFMIKTDTARSRVKYIAQMVNLNTSERNKLDDLIRICDAYAPDLSPRIERFLLKNQTQNILPTVGNNHIITSQYTGDALSDLELASAGWHDLNGLVEFLRSKGF
jgi:hypothetical protein